MMQRGLQPEMTSYTMTSPSDNGKSQRPFHPPDGLAIRHAVSER